MCLKVFIVSCCRYAYGYYLLLIIPLIPFACSAFLSGVALLWSRRIKRRSFGRFHMRFMCTNNVEFWIYARSCFKASMPFLGIVYNNICLKSFNTFACQELRDGTYVVLAAPSVVCWDSEEHHVMVGIAILAIIVYVVGVPTTIVGSLVYANQHDFLRDPTWLSCMGDNYLWYGMHLQLLRVRSKLRWPACRESSCVSRVVPREKKCVCACACACACTCNARAFV